MKRCCFALLVLSMFVCNGCGIVSADTSSGGLDPTVLVGTWNITNYPADDDTAASSTGTVVINADGTYSVTNGAFRVAGNYINAPYTGTWRILEGAIVELVTDVPDVVNYVDSGRLSLKRKYPVPIIYTKAKVLLKDGNSLAVLKPS